MNLDIFEIIIIARAPALHHSSTPTLQYSNIPNVIMLKMTGQFDYGGQKS
jgi:hypothetical protein